MRVLVTRPEPDAQVTAAELVRLGHEPVLAPMLRTVFAADVRLPTEGIAALVATSQNGLRAVAAATAFARLRLLPLFVVGDASARLAKTLGFANVHSAAGSLSDLVTLMADSLNPSAGPCLYAAGHDRSGDLAGDLARHGFRVDMVEVYHSEPLDHLPDAIATDLKAGRIDRVLIFSARSATAFVATLAASDLLTDGLRLTFHAISAQAAGPLRAAGIQRISLAERPDSDALLRCLAEGV